MFLIECRESNRTFGGQPSEMLRFFNLREIVLTSSPDSMHGGEMAENLLPHDPSFAVTSPDGNESSRTHPVLGGSEPMDPERASR
jgi:hypothetical protein